MEQVSFNQNGICSFQFSCSNLKIGLVKIQHTLKTNKILN